MPHKPLIAEITLFKDLTEDQARRLSQRSSQVGTLARGDILFDAGDAAEAIFVPVRRAGARHAGGARVRVELAAVPPEKALRFERVIENELFGEFEFFCDGMRHPAGSRLARETRAQLLAPGAFLRIPLDILADLLDENAAFRRRFVSLAAARLKWALASQRRHRYVDLDSILAEYLLDLAADYATTYDSYAVFTRKVAQEEMAADLGISRRALSDRLGAWVEAGLLRTTPLALLDTRRVEQLQRIGREAPDALVASVSQTVMAWIDDGELALARAMALDFMRHFPGAATLAFGAALAAARSAAPREAEQILTSAGLWQSDPDHLEARILYGLTRPSLAVPDPLPERADILDDADALEASNDGSFQGSTQIVRDARRLTGEILSLRARLAKDRAWSGDTFDAAQALAARDLYLKAWQATGKRDAYPLVNAASMALVGGDRDGASTLATRSLALQAGDDYWSSASQIEGLLVAGEGEKALKLAGTAMACEPEEGRIATTRRQLGLLIPHIGLPCEAVLDALVVPRPLVYSGSLLSRGNLDADLPLVEAEMRQRVAEFFACHRIGAVHGALARGADMIIAEEAIRAGCAVHAVLPFDVLPFAEVSVIGEEPDGAALSRRLDELLSNCRSVTIAQPGKPAARDLEISFRHGFRTAAALTIQRAAELHTKPLLLAVSISGKGGAIAGTDADVADWTRQGRAVVKIDLPFRKLRAPSSGRTQHGFCAAVFCFPSGDSDPGRFIAEGLSAIRVPLIGVSDRQIKDGRRGAVAVVATIEEAAALAFALDDLRRAPRNLFRGRIICDYGAVLGRSGSVDPNLLARMAAGGDFPSFPDDRPLASAPFAREVQFLTPSGFGVVAIGQRLSPVGGGERTKVSPGLEVYGLARSDPLGTIRS